MDLRPQKVSNQLNYGAGKARFDQRIKFLLEVECICFVISVGCVSGVSFQPITFSFSALISLCGLFYLPCHVFKGVPLFQPIPLVRDKVRNIGFFHFPYYRKKKVIFL